MIRIALIIPAVFCIAMAGILQQADAQSSRVYLAGYLGLNTPFEADFNESFTPASGEIEFENGLSFAGALGLRLNREWRAEIELSRRSSAFDSADINGVGSQKMGGDLTSWLLMVNGYYDFDVAWPVRPFLNAGVGFARHEGNPQGAAIASTDNDDSFGLAWSLGGGLKYRVSPDMAFTGGYRYIGTTDMEIGPYEMDNATHEFRVGVEWDLPH